MVLVHQWLHVSCMHVDEDKDENDTTASQSGPQTVIWFMKHTMPQQSICCICSGILLATAFQ